MKTDKKTKGKGHYKAVPLTFTVDGQEFTYAGRGRHSRQLAQAIVATSTFPVQVDGNWTWREASADELTNARDLVKRAEDKAEALAEATGARKQAKAEAKAEREKVRAEAAAARAAAKAEKAAAKAVAKAGRVPVAVAETATSA